MIGKPAILKFAAMTATLERIKADFKKLTDQGIHLHNALRVEQIPEIVEEHFTEVLKMDYQAFTKTLPSFALTYQNWYSQARELISVLLPGRLNDFTALYQPPKNRKEIKKENYTLEDYLKDVKVFGFEDKVLVGPVHAIPAFEQQLQILNSVKSRFESSLLDIQQLIRTELLDAELDAAELLLKNKCLRAAGVICGVVLSKHLVQVSGNHHLKISKKNPSVAFLNDLLKKKEVYDVPTWRFIQSLDDVQSLCQQSKKREPLPPEINDLIIGVDKVIKTVW